MFIRTKRKGSEVISDLHHFTNKWQEVPDGEVRVAYMANSNLQVSEEKPSPPKQEPAVASKPTPDKET